MSSNGPIRRKLVIVGDGACGKTSLLCVFAMGEFPKEYEPSRSRLANQTQANRPSHFRKLCRRNQVRRKTRPARSLGYCVSRFEQRRTGIDVATCSTFVISCHRLVQHPLRLVANYIIWRLGQEEYERLRPLSYAKAHVILIAFSVDTPDSLDNVTVKWVEEVRNICGAQIPIILVGCKADLRPAAGSSADGKQYVTRQRAQAVAQEIGARGYKECSALNNQGVDDVFEAATRASMIVREVKAESGEEHSGGCGCVLC
ncbi:unnamed protein product [Rhizoctonia solani]|uniref:GTP-binding protein rho2 n=1 Tax=Rhizoctonia solani TaxID=456999 RepID=A0A8H3DX61_9AGAM|nr:unnamed protein product [Rhizoctonia solani]